MTDEDKTFSGSLVLDLRIWWRHLYTLYNSLLQFNKQSLLKELGSSFQGC